MLKTIGQLIGTVVDNFSVTNTAGASVQIRALIDYSTVADIEIISWLNGNRRIPLQRVLRAKSASEIKALDGSVFNAASVGQKVKSDEQVKAEYMTRFNSSTPETKAQMIEELQAGMVSVVSEEQAEDERSAMQDAYDEDEVDEEYEAATRHDLTKHEV